MNEQHFGKWKCRLRDIPTRFAQQEMWKAADQCTGSLGGDEHQHLHYKQCSHHHTQPTTQHVMFLHLTTFTKRHTMFITHLTLCITGQQTIGAQRWAAILSSADVVLLNTLQIYHQWFCLHSVLPQMCYKPLAFSFVGAQRTAQWFVLYITESWPEYSGWCWVHLSMVDRMMGSSGLVGSRRTGHGPEL